MVTLTTLASFTGGIDPNSDLVEDVAGDLFGTTVFGGADNNGGSVFEIVNTSTGYSASPVTVVSFSDLVLTRSGVVRPVVWIGQRHVDCFRHPMPEQVWPVRVSAGAFGEAQPHSDLWLSPDHAVFVDGVLIPIKCLINGITVEQIPLDEVIYYHIELSEHDVLFAEGLPAESWLDTGGRSTFATTDGSTSLFAGLSVPSRGPYAGWETMACAPLIIFGSQISTARRKLHERAPFTGPRAPTAATASI